MVDVMVDTADTADMMDMVDMAGMAGMVDMAGMAGMVTATLACLRETGATITRQLGRWRGAVGMRSGRCGEWGTRFTVSESRVTCRHVTGLSSVLYDPYLFFNGFTATASILI